MGSDKGTGGSSGGSCAAVAAGEAFLALGSDTGGSIRQPSSYCGVVGMKPTYGTVSRYGLIAYASSLDQIGPVAKNVSDCTALLEAISGYDKKDSTSIERNDLNFTEALNGDLKGVRVGIPAEYLSEGLDEDVKKTLQETVELMRANGAVVEEFSLGLVDYVIPAYYIIASAEASSNLARFDGVKYGYRAEEFEGLHDMYKKSRAQGFGEEVKRRILLGSFVLSSGYYDAYYLKALKVKAMIKKAFDDAFAKYDMILAPAAPSTAPKVGSSLQDPLKMYLSDVYTAGVKSRRSSRQSVFRREKSEMECRLVFSLSETALKKRKLYRQLMLMKKSVEYFLWHIRRRENRWQNNMKQSLDLKFM